MQDQVAEVEEITPVFLYPSDHTDYIMIVAVFRGCFFFRYNTMLFLQDTC